MSEPLFLFTIGGLSVSAYACFIFAGILLGAVIFCLSARHMAKNAAWLTIGLSVILGLLCARAFYVLARLDWFIEVGLDSFFRAAEPADNFWGGTNGAALWGAAGGIALSCLIAGKLTRTRVSQLLDAMAPAAALTVALSRFGEYFIGEGIGPDVTQEALCFFPIAIVNEWEEWKYAIFILEGIAALLIFVLLITRGKTLTNGYRARYFLILYCSSQIILESLRRDSFLRWLFVRVSQLTAVLVLFGMILFAIARWRKKAPAERMQKKTVVTGVILFFLFAGICVALEFAIDKSATMPLSLAYLLEAVCCIGFGVISHRLIMKN